MYKKSLNNDYLIIAEIGQAHDGSLGILHSYIDALAETGVNVVKFQTHIASAESSQYEPFRIPFSFEDKTRYDYWRRMEFTRDQWLDIKAHCEEKGLQFLSSPFSVEALELLEGIGTEMFKVGSGEMTNYLLLDKIAQIGKPVILSSGLSNMHELKSAIDRLKGKVNDITLLQCTTQYPTPMEKVGINLIDEFRNSFQACKIGLSDHSGEVYPILAAATLGASVFEFHAVFDKRMFGPDSSSSLEMSQIKELVQGLKAIKCMLENPVSKLLDDDLSNSKIIFGKSLAVRRDLKCGEEIQFRDLESKKPSGMGLDASRYQELLGKVLKVDIKKNGFIKLSDVE